jgi:hypothetical protein
MWSNLEDIVVAIRKEERIHTMKCGMQIGVWYFLSDPVRSGSKLAAKISSEPGENSKEGRLKGDAPSAKSFGSDSSKGNTYSELVENMIPAAGSADLPPPSLSHDGEFSDWVYTIPCTKYDRTEV